ncbi:hypothetical protein INT47_009771 [Mucor saturninus]|uniref:Uncharacterized protein n=1 Tax=Mucor saturninus TaxID=64648 RepID=A0A8H7QSN0_9FUNG|nr:hypothetical protein INT47_009771 [Mucor saturninus]
MAYPVRSYSLKSPWQKPVAKSKKKQRRRTWHPTRPCSIHPISPRVSKWRAGNSFLVHPKRLTVATISTLTSSNTSSSSPLPIDSFKRMTPVVNVFHLQSTLFLFGFLCFPCWWVGGYCLPAKHTAEYGQVMMAVHPSLLANGRMCSKTLWTCTDYDPEKDTILMFYRWNRFMALVSVALVLFILSLFIWYYVAY